jgi:hypothetical protein
LQHLDVGQLDICRRYRCVLYDGSFQLSTSSGLPCQSAYLYGLGVSLVIAMSTDFVLLLMRSKLQEKTR